MLVQHRENVTPPRQVMQRLGFWMRVSAEHFPVFVTGHERDLLNREPGLEQASGPFVAQVVKMQVLYPEFATAASKCRADRPAVLGKYPALDRPEVEWLFGEDSPTIVTAGSKQRDRLIVSQLVPRVLAVAVQQHPRAFVHIGPINSADFIQIRGDGVAVNRFVEESQFVSGRPAFKDQSPNSKSVARQKRKEVCEQVPSANSGPVSHLRGGCAPPQLHARCWRTLPDAKRGQPTNQDA